MGKKKKDSYGAMLEKQAAKWPVDELTGIKRYRNNDGKTRELTDKILRNEVILLMAKGLLIDEVAAELDLSVEMLEARMKSSIENQQALQIALTKLSAYYQKNLRAWIKKPYNDKALTLFYSHFLKVMERKRPVEIAVEDVAKTHEQALRELDD